MTLKVKSGCRSGEIVQRLLLIPPEPPNLHSYASLLEKLPGKTFGLYSTFITPIFLPFFLPQGFSCGQRSQAVEEEIRVMTKCPAWVPCQELSDISQVFTFVLLPKMRFKLILFSLIQPTVVEYSEGDSGMTPTVCSAA